MKPVTLPYLQSYKDRHGHQRHYFRRGSVRKALPGAPGSPEFLEAYQIAKSAPTTPASQNKAVAGTIEALVQEFYASGEFTQGLAASTQREYRYRLEWLRERYGDKWVKSMGRRNVLRMRDEKAETPGEANTLLRIVRRLLSFAVDREYRDDNPALRIKLFEGGEFRDWSDDELAKFERAHKPGAKERLAYALLLYTGQRRSDVAKMIEADFRGHTVRVVQVKTGEKVWIKAHPRLRDELGKRKGKTGPILLNGRGESYTSEGLGQFMADAIDTAELPDDCVTHGLRKTAARKLAEAGCSEDEIMAVTGHTTSAMVRLYVKGAKRAKMAESAMAKLGRQSKREKGRKPQKRKPRVDSPSP